LLLLPLVTLGLYLLMRLMHLIDPGKANYEVFSRAFTAIRTALVLFMAAVYGASLLATFGHKVNMTTVVCFALAALFAVIGNFMGKIRPNWFVGVRTPWTLSSKMSWDKTHRLAGWLFLAMALLIAALGTIQTTWMFIVMLVGNGACILWMIVYSYLIYRDDPDRNSPPGASARSE
jgi:uncharacterized membrane protein